MKFYLGIHEPQMLHKCEVPKFISYRRLMNRKSDIAPIGEWSLDSGGFSEISQHGTWTISPQQYIQDVGRYVDWGGLNWAAPQDWMVEPRRGGSSGRHPYLLSTRGVLRVHATDKDVHK